MFSCFLAGFSFGVGFLACALLLGHEKRGKMRHDREFMPLNRRTSDRLKLFKP